MSSIFKEQYQNLILVMKEALTFYALKDNYIANQFTSINASSLIELDNGHQARQVIEQVNNVMKMTEEFENDYENIIKAADNQTVDPQELIKEFKKFTDGNKI